MLVQLFRTAGRFDMEVQPSLVLLQKTLLNVEGLGRQLYPDLDLWQTALPFLEKWNSKRLNPVTLFNRIKDNIPDWLDQLPELPQLVINSLKQSEQLAAINTSLVKQQKSLEQQAYRRQRRSRLVGILALVIAGVAAHPAVAQISAGVPLTSILLALAGAYLVFIQS